MFVTSKLDFPALTQGPLDAAGYEAIIAELRAQTAVLLARVAELERRLGRNSTNSSKPPGSDGLNKPPRTRSLRERSGKLPGGQKGHHGKTLTRTPTPDAVVDHFPTACGNCGGALRSSTCCPKSAWPP